MVNYFFLRIQQLIVQAVGSMCNQIFAAVLISLGKLVDKKPFKWKYKPEKILEGKEWSDISILICHSSTCNTPSATKDTHTEY